MSDLHGIRPDRHDRGVRGFLHLLRDNGGSRFSTYTTAELETAMRQSRGERPGGQFRSGVDLRAAQDSRVQLPHRLLRQHRDRPMDGCDGLQDSLQFTAASRHGQLDSESGSAPRDRFGLPGVLRAQPHPEDVSLETGVVATRNIICYHHSDLRGVEEVVGQETSGRLLG